MGLKKFNPIFLCLFLRCLTNEHDFEHDYKKVNNLITEQLSHQALFSREVLTLGLSIR